jgi:hypothetical protein
MLRLRLTNFKQYGGGQIDISFALVTSTDYMIQNYSGVTQKSNYYSLLPTATSTLVKVERAGKGEKGKCLAGDRCLIRRSARNGFRDHTAMRHTTWQKVIGPGDIPRVDRVCKIGSSK